MKKLYITVLIAAFAFASCEVEPDFPLPGFTDGTRDVTFRRDTVPTSYDIGFSMTLSNPVKSIELIDGYNSEHIDWMEDYSGQKEFTLTYTQDLTGISSYNDTALYRKFRIVDTAGGAYNRMCKMTILKLSRPEVIGISEGSTVNIQGEIFKPTAKIATGMVPLKSVEYLWGEETCYYYEFTDSRYEYTLNKGVGLMDYDVDEGAEYPFSIVVTDTNNRSETTKFNVKVSPMVKPSRVIFTNTANTVYYFDFTYDDENRITEMAYINAKTGSTSYTYIFAYDDNDMVSSLTRRSSSDRIIDYSYDENNRLTAIGNYKDYTNFTYDGDGTLLKYHNGSEYIERPFYADILDINAKLLTLYMNYYGPNTSDSYIAEVKSYSSVYMPTYIKGLPPFINFGTATAQYFLYDLFCYMLMPSYVSLLDGYESGSEANYSAEMNEDGTLHRVTATYSANSKWYAGKSLNYEFIYGSTETEE